LFVSNVPAKSNKCTWSPVKGVAGNVTVWAAAVVSMKYLSFEATVKVVEPSAVNVCQGLPPPKPVHWEPL
jgi:hypothetical protein